MSTTLHTITADAAYLTATEEAEAIKRFQKKYHVKGTYHRNGDHYSSWTLTGTKAHLKKCLKAEWGTDEIMAEEMK